MRLEVTICKTMTWPFTTLLAVKTCTTLTSHSLGCLCRFSKRTLKSSSWKWTPWRTWWSWWTTMPLTAQAQTLRSSWRCWGSAGQRSAAGPSKGPSSVWGERGGDCTRPRKTSELRKLRVHCRAKSSNWTDIFHKWKQYWRINLELI